MRAHILLTSIIAFPATGCLGSLATGALADAMSSTGGVYATDEDPELVREAVPFGLKTMESVLVEEPEHVGLLTALASGFAQYAYAFIDEDAKIAADQDLERGARLQRRALALYLRAREYGMRGLEASHEGFRELFAKDRAAALRLAEKEDVPLLYWTAVSWGLAIGASLSDTSLIAQYPDVEAVARRALELDETWNDGALHEFFVTFEASAPSGSLAKAREHFARAIQLSNGRRAGPYVTLAEKVCVKEQKAAEFHELLKKALAIDVDASLPDRLANVIMQRRARRLQKASSDLFLEDAARASAARAPRLEVNAALLTGDPS